jgi:hypothetical protein
MAAALRELEDKCRVRLEGRTEGMEGLRIAYCLLLFFTFFALFFFFFQNMRGGAGTRENSRVRVLGSAGRVGTISAGRSRFCENLLTPMYE